MRVLVAPDKFKGAATAAQVGAAIAAGLRDADPSIDVDVLPIADGGDGTVDAALAAGFEPQRIRVRGPVGDVHDATIALQSTTIHGKTLHSTTIAMNSTTIHRRTMNSTTALIELANTCGVVLLPGGVLRPLDAHTGGLGDAIAAALDLGADDLILAVGGSASTDAGLGALIALGARVRDSNGRDVPPGAGTLAQVSGIDLTGIHPGLSAARLRIITDVDNPLLGPRGSVAVFGPQKGIAADAAGVEAGMANVARVIRATSGTDIASMPGGGAAGGIAAAFAGLLGAQIVPGAQFVLDLLGVRDRMGGVDLVITGEGAFDQQTMHGKGPGAILDLAREQGIPAAVIAGRIDLDAETLRTLGLMQATALTALANGDVDAAMRDCLNLAQRAGKMVGDRLSDRAQP
ncbi:MAG: glycerate kinase [Jatrophihabitantaceae bacterium]|nr:glycerate kinase [Jatrophihabitantaceae bacterium]